MEQSASLICKTWIKTLCQDEVENKEYISLCKKKKKQHLALTLRTLHLVPISEAPGRRSQHIIQVPLPPIPGSITRVSPGGVPRLRGRFINVSSRASIDSHVTLCGHGFNTAYSPNALALGLTLPFALSSMRFFSLFASFLDSCTRIFALFRIYISFSWGGGVSILGRV